MAEDFNWLEVEDNVCEPLHWKHFWYSGCSIGQNIWENFEKFWESSDRWYYVGIFVEYYPIYRVLVTMGHKLNVRKN